MKVYISVDMEGIAGISHPGPTNRSDLQYPAAAALMVGEANAAIDGAFRGGATEVVVNDSHGSMHNLTPIDLDPRARLVQGQKAWSTGHDRPHLFRSAGCDQPERASSGREWAQRDCPRRMGRAGRPGLRRRPGGR